MRIRFGEYCLSINERRLDRPQGQLNLGDRACQVLKSLLDRPNSVVSKNDILDVVWPNLAVEENTLQVHISTLRKALGPEIIKTVHGRGYQYIGPEPVIVEQGASGHDDGMALDIADVVQNKIPKTFQTRGLVMPFSSMSYNAAGEPELGQLEVPAIAVERITSAPETRESLEASADLQEQLLHNLSLRTGVRVLATDPVSDARATYSLRCRLRCRQSEAKISASLIRRSDGQIVWSHIFLGNVSDLLELSDRAAEQISGALRLQINAFDADRLSDLPDEQLSASELRARAAMLFYRATVVDYVHALRLLERALGLDPEHASSLAMWCEGQLFTLEAHYRKADPDLSEKIIKSSNKAIQASPRSDYCWYIRAHVRARIIGDLEGARKDIDRLRRLNPGYVLGMEASGITELVSGNWELARVSLTQAVERSADDPFLPFRLYPLAITQMMVGEPQLALATISDATELRPDCRHYWLVKAWILKETGRKSEAERAVDIANGIPERADILAQNLHLPDDVRDAIGLPTKPIVAQN